MEFYNADKREQDSETIRVFLREVIQSPHIPAPERLKAASQLHEMTLRD